MDEQWKRFVYELMMEYVKQNELLHCAKESIPQKIDHLVEVENILCECVKNRLRDFKTL